MSLTRDRYQRPELARVAYCRALLVTLCGNVPASEFGPVRLRACRDAMVTGWVDRSVAVGLAHRAPLSRLEVNARTNLIRRLFKIGASYEMVPAAILAGLKTVEPLRRGHTAARETEPRRPVPAADLEATMAKLSDTVRRMVIVQECTAMRPSELVAMRVEQVDRSSLPWLYTPSSHKCAWRGSVRRIPLGPRARAAMEPLPTDGFVFSPAREQVRRSAERRAKRRTKIQPSQAEPRRVANPKWRPGPCYSVASYQRAVSRACTAAGADPWTPYALRHGGLARVREEFGIEASQAIAGHASIAATQLYTRANQKLAARIAESSG
jgi:integrase